MSDLGADLAKGGEHVEQHAGPVEGLDYVFVEAGLPVLLVRPQEKLHGVVLQVGAGNHLHHIYTEIKKEKKIKRMFQTSLHLDIQRMTSGCFSERC